MTAFQIREKHQNLQKLASEGTVTIPAGEYPKELFKAPISKVQTFLLEHGLMQHYFAALKAAGDQVVLDFFDGRTPAASPMTWPTEKIYPGTYRYRYQIERRRALPSQWSAPEKLRIALEPPRNKTTQLVLGPPGKDGLVPMGVQISPILFASGYEIQFDHDDRFHSPKSNTAVTPEFQFNAQRNQTYFWRVRALDQKGAPLTEFSRVARIDGVALEPEIRRAEVEHAHRSPAAATVAASAQPSTKDSPPAAQTLSTQTKTKTRGFWTWIGSGISDSRFEQSIVDRGTITSRSLNALGANIEVGWANHIVGGILGYKSTPETLRLDNASVDQSSSNWQTFSAEMLYCPMDPGTLANRPFQTGFRAGLLYHQMPFGLLDTNNVLHIMNLTAVNASAGASVEWAWSRWHYYGNARYQYPLSLKASEAAIRPSYAVDGSLGTAYSITQQFKTGLFLYGEWQQFNFTSNEAAVSGTQTLFSSALDLRLGFDF